MTLLATILAFAATATASGQRAEEAVKPKPPARCKTAACRRRVRLKRFMREWRRAPGPHRAHLRRIADCESHGDETAVSANGQFRGLLQFTYGTWGSVGGADDPAKAPRIEQWARGARLYARRGAKPWPVCGAQ